MVKLFDPFERYPAAWLHKQGYMDEFSEVYKKTEYKEFRVKRFSAILIMILIALSFFVSCCDDVVIPSDPPASNINSVEADITAGKDTTMVVLSSPSNPTGTVSDANTTVVILAGATGAGSAILTVKPYTVGDLIIETEVDKAVVGGLDLELVVNNTTVSDFDEPVVVTTYIAKGLSGVTVKYNGEEIPLTDIEYETTTGKLTFKTNHFSVFYVASDSVAYIPETNMAYSSLQEAIEAVSEGETIKLINNITAEQGYLFDKNISVVLDLNSKTLKVTNDTSVNQRAIKVTSGTLTIKNGTIDGRNVDSSGNPEDFNDKDNYTQGMYGTVRIEGSESTPAKVVLSDVDLYNNHLWGLSVKTITKYSSVEMYNSRVHSNIGGGIEVAYGNAKISDSVFEQQGVSNYSKYISVAIAVSGLGSVEIEDTDMSVSGTHALYIYDSGGIITVKGGTFESTSELVWVDGAAYDSEDYSEEEYNSFKESHGGKTSIVNIEGGDFTGELKIGSSNSDLSAINISGGTFDRKPATGYIVEGYALSTEGGLYKVEAIEAWDGTSDTYWYNDSDTIFELWTAEQLAGLAELVNDGNNFKGKTINLFADIDLGGKEWTPIGKNGKPFEGVFDGGENTISNLHIDKSTMSNVGLFGYTMIGEIKNLVLNNAEVKGYLEVGAIAGTPYTSKYTNIKLTGKVEVNGYSYIGGMFGKNAYADLTDLTINATEGSYVKADSENYRTYVGGVIGFMGEGSYGVTNVSSNIDVYGSTCDVGGITGIAHYGNSFINCSSSGNVTLENAQDEGDQYEIGGISGVWMNSPEGDVTLTNCSFTGTLTTYLKGNDCSDKIEENNRLSGTKYFRDSNEGKLTIN